MKCDELKDKWFNAYPEIMGIEGTEPTSINGASMPCEGMLTMRTARDWAMIWEKVERKCRAKAEEYK